MVCLEECNKGRVAPFFTQLFLSADERHISSAIDAEMLQFQVVTMGVEMDEWLAKHLFRCSVMLSDEFIDNLSKTSAQRPFIVTGREMADIWRIPVSVY